MRHIMSASQAPFRSPAAIRLTMVEPQNAAAIAERLREAGDENSRGGAALFHERNLRSKAVDLAFILVGMFFLWLGSR